MAGFVVKRVSVAEIEDLNAFIVALKGTDGTGEYLELQKSLTFDDQDIELGMNTYCTVTDAGACHYGGIVSCVLEKASLVLEYTAEAATILGIAARVELPLQLEDAGLRELRSGLLRLFRDDVRTPTRLVV